MTETPLINSVTTRIAPINTETATSYVTIPATENVFSTPSQSIRTSSQATNEDVVQSDLGSNPFVAFESGVFLSFESNYDVSAQRF